MRWTLLVLVVLWPLASEAACPSYSNVTMDVAGNVIPGVTITVKRSGDSAHAALFTDKNCTITLPSPTESSATGTYVFYAHDGRYDLSFTKTGYTFESATNIELYEPMGEDVALLADFLTTDLAAVGVGAFDVLGSSTRTLVINQPATTSLTDTCPSTVTLLFVGSGTLAAATSTTLTLNCRVVNLTDHDVLIGAGTYVKSAASIGTKHIPVTFAELGTPANGYEVYCSDCTVANPCAGSGTGAMAKRLNAAWRCD